MKLILGLLLLLLPCGVVTQAQAQTNRIAAAKLAAPPAAPRSSAGLELAKTLSLITGVAISPLLGVGAVGAWDYFSTPKEQRTHLDWYAEPVFWIPALLLVALVALKDILGTAAPSALKKPFDVAELIENKISGLVAAGAFVPLIIKIFGPHSVPGSQALLDSGLGAAGFAAIDVASVLNTLVTPFAIIAFLLVWLASNAITILIVISPFTSVDAALKTFRMVVLSLVTVTHFLNPYIGALVAVGIILVSYFLAGWSFRLFVLGWVFAWDFLTRRRTRFLPQANGNWMFTAEEIGGAPLRTYGRLVRGEDGQLAFEYGPWILMKKRSVAMPRGNYAVGRGLFYPEILLRQGDNARTLLMLPPRYRTHEEEVASTYEFGEVRDVGLLKGFIAGWALLKALVGLGPAVRPGTA
jgi:hypothetical protein